MKYKDVIAISGDKLGCINVLEHNITLEDGTKPIYVRAYRILEKYKLEVGKEIGEILSEV